MWGRDVSGATKATFPPSRVTALVPVSQAQHGPRALACAASPWGHRPIFQVTRPGPLPCVSPVVMMSDRADTDADLGTRPPLPQLPPLGVVLDLSPAGSLVAPRRRPRPASRARGVECRAPVLLLRSRAWLRAAVSAAGNGISLAPSPCPVPTALGCLPGLQAHTWPSGLRSWGVLSPHTLPELFSRERRLFESSPLRDCLPAPWGPRSPSWGFPDPSPILEVLALD